MVFGRAEADAGLGCPDLGREMLLVEVPGLAFSPLAAPPPPAKPSS